MRQSLSFFVSVIIVASVASIAFADDVSSKENVEVALEDLHQWLGDGRNGQKWQKYLRSDELVGQLKNGDQADRQAIQSVLDQYNSGAAGLDKRRFIAVRDALQKWRADLPGNLEAIHQRAGQRRRSRSETQIP